MYNTILLAVALQRWTRHSAHALAARGLAANLARSTSQPLHVLSVYEYEHPSTRGDLPPHIVAKLREQVVQQTDSLMIQKLDEYLVPLVQDGLKISKLLRVGHPRDVIVKVAAEMGADLLIIGSHSKRGFLDIALGGTAQHVTRHAPCTVVLVSPGSETRLEGGARP